MTGMKKSVTKRMPVLLTNSPTVPQFPQRICRPEGSEPHVTKRVPMMKMKNNVNPFALTQPQRSQTHHMRRTTNNTSHMT